MTQELLDKARDNRYRASGKRELNKELLRKANELDDLAVCSAYGWKIFEANLDYINGFSPEIRRPILSKMCDILRDGFSELAMKMAAEAEELDEEFDAL